MITRHTTKQLTTALAVALASGTALQALAQDSRKPAGQIIQIGPDQGGGEDLTNLRREARPLRPEGQHTGPEAPRHWIGLLGGPVSEELRHHVDLATDTGLFVLEVVPGSPAAEAGLQKFDIMIKANDIELREMGDLVELVRTAGDEQGSIVIEVMRHGQRETVEVTPAERPADAAAAVPIPPQPGGNNPFGQFFQQFGRRPDGGLQGRHFGPGVIVGAQRLNIAQLPNGVSVKVEKRNDQPTKITVEQNGQQWVVEGDDPEALDQLPDDVRPYVEQMLGQDDGLKVHGFDFGNLQQQLPQLEAQFEEFGPMMNEASRQMLERIEQMETQMRQLQERFQGQPAEEHPADQAEEGTLH